MKIYKTETYKVIDHKDYLDVPTKYYLDYLAAVASIPEHGGELTKYEDCHSDTFCHREVWVERGKFVSDFADLVDGYAAPSQYRTYIWEIETAD